MIAKNLIHKGSWSTKIFDVGKWYLLGNFLTKGTGILLLPILTAYLSTYEYGLLDTIVSFALFFPFIISLGVDSAFGRLYHDYKEDDTELSKLFSTSFWFITLFGGFVITIVLATSKMWSMKILSIDPYPLLFIAFIPLLLTQLGKLGLTLLQQNLQSKKITFINFIATVIKLMFVITLLVYFTFGIKAVLVGNAISSFCIFAFVLFYVLKENVLKFEMDLSVLKETLRYSIPLLPTFAFVWVNSLVDRLVIANFDSFEGVGIYSFAFQIGLIIYFFGDSIARVVSPMSISGLVADKESVKIKLSETSLMLISLMSIIALASLFYAAEIIMILGNEKYYDAIKLIPIIVLPSVWGMQYRFFVILIKYSKKTWMLTVSALFSALVNLILNLVFVPKYGYVAGAYSTLVSSLVYFGITYFYSKRILNVNFMVLRSVLIVSILILASVIFILSDIRVQLDIKFFFLKTILLTCLILLILKIGKIDVRVVIKNITQLLNNNFKKLTLK